MLQKNLFLSFFLAKICRNVEGTDAVPFHGVPLVTGHRHLEITVARLCEKQVFD